jgi:hypothetical protein
MCPQAAAQLALLLPRGLRMMVMGSTGLSTTVLRPLQALGDVLKQVIKDGGVELI